VEAVGEMEVPYGIGVCKENQGSIAYHNLKENFDDSQVAFTLL
jgi:hypothetical protein